MQLLLVAMGGMEIFFNPLPAATAKHPNQDGSSSAPLPLPSSSGLALKMEKMSDGENSPFIDPKKSYTLPELIDLAQRHNRTTRVAWQNARQAAASTGLSAAEFYPMLAVAATYGGGFWNLNLKFNNNLTGIEKQAGLIGSLLAGATPADLSLNQQASGAYEALNAGVVLRWMLFDFGTRAAVHDSAKKSQLATSLLFNAAHQSVAFRVTQAYYALESTRRLTEASATSASSAAELLAAVEEKYSRGLLTEPVLMQARQARAQAEFELVNARAKTELSRIDLAEAVGASPESPLHVVPADFNRLGNQLQEPLDRFVQSALHRRPDLLAKVAMVQAAEARVRAVKADGLPKFSLNGIAQDSQFNTSVQGTGPLDSFGLGLQNYGGFVMVQWPLFDGFADANKIRAAKSAWNAANEDVLLSRDHAIAEVWRAYTQVKTSLARREAAIALETASRTSYDSLRASFESGITPIQDVVAARAVLAQSSAISADCDQAIAASLALLAFGSGML